MKVLTSLTWEALNSSSVAALIITIAPLCTQKMLLEAVHLLPNHPDSKQSHRNYIIYNTAWPKAYVYFWLIIIS